MHFSTVFTTIALAASSVAALGPVVPPQNPPANGDSSYCTSRTECLTIINNVRADQEGLDPIKLPTNWNKLTYPERLFTFMNLERVSRNLSPLTHLVNTYASEVKTGVTNDADPMPPSGMYNSWNSIWAGGSNMIPLAAIYGWMYFDGPGGFNLDCQGSSDGGCWGHRDAILNADVNKIDVGAGQDSQGQKGFAAILFAQDGAPAAADTVLAWADQKPKCSL